VYPFSYFWGVLGSVGSVGSVGVLGVWECWECWECVCMCIQERTSGGYRGFPKSPSNRTKRPYKTTVQNIVQNDRNCMCIQERTSRGYIGGLSKISLKPYKTTVQNARTKSPSNRAKTTVQNIVQNTVQNLPQTVQNDRTKSPSNRTKRPYKTTVIACVYKKERPRGIYMGVPKISLKPYKTLIACVYKKERPIYMGPQNLPQTVQNGRTKRPKRIHIGVSVFLFLWNVI